MAKRFSSPGVVTNEIDQSFLAQGVAAIGAVIVGLAGSGPADVPSVVQGFNGFTSLFGGLDPVVPKDGPYCVRNYLRNTGQVTYVRVLGSSDGTGIQNGFVLGGITGIADAQVSGTILAVLHHSGTSSVVSAVGVPLDANSFVLKVGTAFAATASFLSSSANYIGKLGIGDPADFGKNGCYIAQLFPYETPAASASWATAGATGAPTSFQMDYMSGSTSWVKSQPFGGIETNLFRFLTLSHGDSTRADVKIEIANVQPSVSPVATPYGKFDVLVRGFGDTDDSSQVVESFTGLTLDPKDNNYIARRIGDHVEFFDSTQRKFIGNGNFGNSSKKIRVEMSTATAPPQALPWGFRGYARLDFTVADKIADMPLTINQLDSNGNLDASIAWGVSFVSGGISDRMWAMPAAGATIDHDADFSLSFLSASWNGQGKQMWSYNPAILAGAQYVTPVYASASLHAFTMPMFGGFDGFDVRLENPLALTNGQSANDTSGFAAATGGGHAVVSCLRALDTIADPDSFTMNLLAFPGMTTLTVTDHARGIVNDRMDSMYVMDVTGANVPDVIQGIRARNLDDNYTACYYPDVKLQDDVNNVIVRVSPSVAVMGAFAFSDAVSQPWFAAAGLTRGGLGAFGIVDVCDRLTFDDRNSLYENRINPIASFPSEGIVIWGQKTLQIKASALDRVNVRRLLIYAKNLVATAAKQLLFEPDNPNTWQRFVNAVNPIMATIQQNQGIARFKVVMDSTTNTPDVVDRNQMKGKIFLQPTTTAEFISVDFVITNAGVAFGS